MLLLYNFFIKIFLVSQGHYQGPGDLPMPSAKEQTLMWQQNSYMGDSGIHSGAATQVPSLTGKEEEEMDLLDLDNCYQGFTQDQVDEMNNQLNQTRSQRVRAAMFPETLEEGKCMSILTNLCQRGMSFA